MSPIPEQQSSVSLQVPSLYGSLSPSTSDSCMDNLSTQRSQSQRRSEGCLDLAGFGNPGRNTWPNQHRSSLPGRYCLPMLFPGLGSMTSVEINRIFEHKIVWSMLFPSLGIMTVVEINRIFKHKIVNIFLSISYNISFWCTKEPSH